MRRLLLLALSGLALTMPAVAQERAAFDSRQMAAITLRGAPFFAMSGVGYGGERSSGERALRDLARFEDAAVSFEAILADRNSSRAGRLYALLGLRWTNSTEWNQSIAPLLSDRNLVEIRAGCFVFELPVASIASEIERGKYQRPLVLQYVPYSIAVEARSHRARLFAPTEWDAGLQLKRAVKPATATALARAKPARPANRRD